MQRQVLDKPCQKRQVYMSANFSSEADVWTLNPQIPREINTGHENIQVNSHSENNENIG